MDVVELDKFADVTYCKCGAQASMTVTTENVTVPMCRSCAYQLSQDLLDLVRKQARTCHRCIHYLSSNGWNYDGECAAGHKTGNCIHWLETCEHFECHDEA